MDKTRVQHGTGNPKISKPNKRGSIFKLTHAQVDGLRKIGGLILITAENKKVLKDAIERYGEMRQVLKTIEECSELITAILHHFNDGKVKKRFVAEEVADVMIMCRQMAMILGEELVAACIDEKINRLRINLELFGGAK
jgi:NTP pyrophosphatase (non-canonical NTP hydrolase)